MAPIRLDPELLLRTILEGMGQPFYAVDGEWRITLYNEDAARHFGRPGVGDARPQAVGCLRARGPSRTWPHPDRCHGRAHGRQGRDPVDDRRALGLLLHVSAGRRAGRDVPRHHRAQEGPGASRPGGRDAQKAHCRARSRARNRAHRGLVHLRPRTAPCDREPTGDRAAAPAARDRPFARAAGTGKFPPSTATTKKSLPTRGRCIGRRAARK